MVARTRQMMYGCEFLSTDSFWKQEVERILRLYPGHGSKKYYAEEK